MKQRKIPMRMCVGCREMRPKLDLCRVVRNNEGQVGFDTTSKAPGRGAYICINPACLDRAMKTRALERALDSKIASDVYDQLREALALRAKQ